MGMRIKGNHGSVVRLANLLVAIQNSIVQSIVLKVFKRIKLPISRLGSFYGGWWVPREVIEEAATWLLVSCGLGHDISFDQELSKIGMGIIGVESEEFFIGSLVDSGQVPRAMRLVHARVDLKENGGIEIEDLMNLYRSEGEYSKVMIKLDIEGSEFGVLRKLSSKDKLPEILMFECDYLSLIPFFAFLTRVRRTTEVIKLSRLLSQSGYLLYKKENWNFHLIKSDALTSKL